MPSDFENLVLFCSLYIHARMLGNLSLYPIEQLGALDNAFSCDILIL